MTEKTPDLWGAGSWQLRCLHFLYDPGLHWPTGSPFTRPLHSSYTALDLSDSDSRKTGALKTVSKGTRKRASPHCLAQVQREQRGRQSLADPEFTQQRFRCAAVGLEEWGGGHRDRLSFGFPFALRRITIRYWTPSPLTGDTCGYEATGEDCEPP